MQLTWSLLSLLVIVHLYGNVVVHLKLLITYVICSFLPGWSFVFKTDTVVLYSAMAREVSMGLETCLRMAPPMCPVQLYLLDQGAYGSAIIGLSRVCCLSLSDNYNWGVAVSYPDK